MATLQDALRYAFAGIPVFPLAGKKPIEMPGVENVDGFIIPPGQSGFHQATTDPSKIERWFTAYGEPNLGTPTGVHIDAVTGQPNARPFDVLDIDPDHGGMASLALLMRSHGELPETAQQITGSGGHHYCFLSDGKVKNSAGGIAPGIDVRGTGGYIVLPPSIHPDTLEPYRWAQDVTEAELAPWPEWLLTLISEISRKRQSTEVGARIPLGVQEATLMRMAGAMRRHSATKSEIYAALIVVAQERCDPPVSPADVERMATSASSYAPGDNLIGFPIDDAGNAERLVARYGPVIRHVSDSRAGADGWYFYDGRVWEDSTSKVVQHQLETARAYQDAAAAMPEDDAEQLAKKVAHTKNAKAMANERGMTALRKLAATFPEIEVERSELDADPWLFNCANGILDVSTGELLPHDASHMLTRQSPVIYDPDAQSDLWDSYLEWLTAGRNDLARFLQVAAGYSMTADAREEKLFFIHGRAASGKTTFVESVKAVMGSYAMTADFSTFLKGHSVGGPRTDIARLHGARYVSSVEVDQGQALAEGLVKQMTGGDAITARFLYAAEFEFHASHKLWLVANDAPKVSSEDDGLWRRILRIPCDNVVPEGQRDTTLKPRLKDTALSGPAILAWMVKGAQIWRQEGLIVPESIRQATLDYQESQDPITDFIKESCEPEPGGSVLVADLWTAYLAYCKTYRRKPMGKLLFGDRIEGKGYKRSRTSKGRFFQDLNLAANEFSE